MAGLHIAQVGASGNLGSAVLRELLDAGLKLTVLTREGSSSKFPEELQSKFTLKSVDYASPSSLQSALEGVDVVISTLGWARQFEIQKALIDAAIAVGVQRFIPSEFGNDTANPHVRSFPSFFAEKTQTQEYLLEKGKANPDFTYTFCYTNTFLDWQLRLGLLVDLKNHKANLYDGGDRPFSATRLATIGKALVAIVNRLEKTRNQDIYVHDIVTTQNKLIGFAKEIDGAEWGTTTISTEEGEKQAKATLAEGGDAMGSSLTLIARAAYGEGYGGDFTEKLSNEILGISEMTEAELKALVQECMV